MSFSEANKQTYIQISTKSTEVTINKRKNRARRNSAGEIQPTAANDFSSILELTVLLFLLLS
jgi:hypothetical protein